MSAGGVYLEHVIMNSDDLQDVRNRLGSLEIHTRNTAQNVGLILGKLDGLATRSDVATVSAAIDGLVSKADFAALKNRTFWLGVGLIVIAAIASPYRIPSEIWSAVIRFIGG